MTFVHASNGKPQAKTGCHDDMVISFGIALQLDELCPLGKVFEEKRLLRLPEDFSPGKETKREEEVSLKEKCLLAALAAHQDRIEQIEGGLMDPWMINMEID